MFTDFLRKNVWAAGILTILRIYLGWGFLTAGWEKITGATPFSAAGFLQGAVSKPVLVAHTTSTLEYPNYVAFLQNFAIPNVGVFNFLVPWGELLVGIGLITGTLTTAAVFFGMVMNFAYLMAGTVSSNPWDLLIGIFIVVAGYNAGKFGGDYWVIPWIQKYVTPWLHHEVEIGVTTGGKAPH